MKIDPIHPDGWAPAKGYANGMLVTGAARMLFVAGQIAWDAEQELVGRGDIAAQFAQALANVAAVVRAAGGAPEHLVRLTVYVTDKRAYLAATKAIGAAYRDVVGRHYPAMALVQVADLLEEGALVEIEATAALPS
jgi:enamine deaminase RidA (YjgF/YER057c/UK114 family)